MGTYHLQEGAFQLPEILKDKTVHMFTISEGNDPSPFSFVISREKHDAFEDIAGYFRKQWVKLRQALPDLELLSQVTTNVSRQPAIRAEFEWISNGVLLHQTQVCFLNGDSVVTLTATAKKAMTPEWDRAFATIVESFRLRE